MKKMMLMASLFIATVSLAQNNKTIERKGFVIGVGLSGGSFHIQDSNVPKGLNKTEGTLGIPDIKVGFMLSSRTAILLTSAGAIYELNEARDQSFQVFTPTLQYWVKDKLWISGGFGISMDSPAFYQISDIDQPHFNFGYAYSFSSGYEIIQRSRCALDIQAKLQGGRAELSNETNRDALFFMVGIGFNWY